MEIFEKLNERVNGSAVDYKELVNTGAVIVDVRTNQEFYEGHAAGSENIPLSDIQARLEELRGKTVILVCRSGARASQALQFLLSNGIKAYNAGAWQNVA
jgi:phage shock protein E